MGQSTPKPTKSAAGKKCKNSIKSGTFTDERRHTEGLKSKRKWIFTQQFACNIFVNLKSAKLVTDFQRSKTHVKSRNNSCTCEYFDSFSYSDNFTKEDVKLTKRMPYYWSVAILLILKRVNTMSNSVCGFALRNWAVRCSTNVCSVLFWGEIIINSTER